MVKGFGVLREGAVSTDASLISAGPVAPNTVTKRVSLSEL